MPRGSAICLPISESKRFAIDGEPRDMHSIISLLSGVVLAALVYGLSFFPTATLHQVDELREANSRADQKGVDPDAVDTEASEPSPTVWL